MILSIIREIIIVDFVGGKFMGNSQRYAIDLMPKREIEIKKTYDNFEELQNIIESGEYDEGGFYWLNDELSDTQHSFLNFEIMNDNGMSISPIEVQLSKQYDGTVKTQKTGGWTEYSNKPKNVYGREKIKPKSRRKHFNRGHLIADSLIKYTKSFEYNKWQDFVMITDWCNRANTDNGNDKKACGMFYFENKILNTLDNTDVQYKVTPVFKELNTHKDKREYGALPRGIILEAKTENNQNFDGLERNAFKVFIPNAQKNLDINYENATIRKQ